MATHSSILALRIPWTEEPGGLLSIGSHRVGHNWSDLACMHALEKEMAAHSSILAWRIPGTEEPGGLWSMGLHRVRHDWSDLAAAACFKSFNYWIIHFYFILLYIFKFCTENFLCCLLNFLPSSLNIFIIITFTIQWSLYWINYFFFLHLFFFGGFSLVPLFGT